MSNSSLADARTAGALDLQKALSADRLQEIRAICEMPPPILRPVTLDELEKILQRDDHLPVSIQPDGSITAGPPEIRLPVAEVLAIVRELQAYRAVVAEGR